MIVLTYDGDVVNMSMISVVGIRGEAERGEEAPAIGAFSVGLPDEEAVLLAGVPRPVLEQALRSFVAQWAAGSPYYDFRPWVTSEVVPSESGEGR